MIFENADEYCGRYYTWETCKKAIQPSSEGEQRRDGSRGSLIVRGADECEADKHTSNPAQTKARRMTKLVEQLNKTTLPVIALFDKRENL